MLAASAAALGLSVAVLLGLRASRRRSVRPAWERGGGTDEAGAPVRPATLLAAGDDPYGIRFAERLGGTLLDRARRADLEDMQVVSATVGTPAPVVILSAPLAIRGALEGVLRATGDLAQRIEVSSSGDRDLVLRLEGVHKEVLGSISAEACPLLLCAGMLPDRRMAALIQGQNVGIEGVEAHR